MSRITRRGLSVPVQIGLAASAAAVILTLVGLWRGELFTFRSVLLGVILSGGTWGVITWAIVQTVFMVEEDSSGDEQG